MPIDYSKWDKLEVSSSEGEGKTDEDYNDEDGEEGEEELKKKKQQSDKKLKPGTPEVTRFDSPHKVEISSKGYSVSPSTSSLSSPSSSSFTPSKEVREKVEKSAENDVKEPNTEAGNEKKNEMKREEQKKEKEEREKLSRMIRNGAVVFSGEGRGHTYIWNQRRYAINAYICIPNFIQKSKDLDVQIKERSLEIFCSPSAFPEEKIEKRNESQKEEDSAKKKEEKIKIFDEDFAYKIDADEEKWTWEMKNINVNLMLLNDMCNEVYGTTYIPFMPCKNSNEEEEKKQNRVNEEKKQNDSNDDFNDYYGQNSSSDDSNDAEGNTSNNSKEGKKKKKVKERNTLLHEYIYTDIREKEKENKTHTYKIIELSLQKKNEFFGVSIWWPNLFKNHRKIDVTKITDRSKNFYVENKNKENKNTEEKNDNHGDDGTKDKKQKYNFLSAWEEAHKLFKNKVKERVPIDLTEYTNNDNNKDSNSENSSTCDK